ncbi:hypothetical protein PR202_ga22438 [Eleusine coracana subsp. coracana]|uniref:Uncharacterized protein n=1 Tax=Eleusine coracana subsp. coracana TaxID=191504 RepID=A0AAV5D349_ELECO|nr:hypothetical protein PR202_ga22438 [Eleusine coracana subsp. coracana]
MGEGVQNQGRGAWFCSWVRTGWGRARTAPATGSSATLGGQSGKKESDQAADRFFTLVFLDTLGVTVTDGRAARCFMTAWGQATHGVPIDPRPVHDRVSFFRPRHPPRVEFEHRGAEFITTKTKKDDVIIFNNDDDIDASSNEKKKDEKSVVVMHRVHFTRDTITELKSLASKTTTTKPLYTTFQCIVVHLWRCITKARNNLTPTATTQVARIDDAYFRSFIDFASSGAVEKEGLVPTANKTDLSLDVEVDSLLGFPFQELDFGCGSPFFYMPSYLLVEGGMFVVPSFEGDGSVDAYVPLFQHNLEAFKQCCASLTMTMDACDSSLAGPGFTQTETSVGRSALLPRASRPNNRPLRPWVRAAPEDSRTSASRFAHVNGPN